MSSEIFNQLLASCSSSAGSQFAPRLGGIVGYVGRCGVGVSGYMWGRIWRVGAKLALATS